MSKTTTSQALTFVSACPSTGTSTSVSTSSFTLELDATRNKNQSKFIPVRDVAFCRLYPGGQAPSLWSNFGTVTTTGQDVDSKTDIITLVDATEATLSSIPSGLFSAIWQGGHQGTTNWTRDNDKLTFSQPTTGILVCTYDTIYDVLQARCPQSASMLIVAKKLTRKGSIVIDFNQSNSLRPVMLTAKDACSKEILSNTSIWIDDKFIGVTNMVGQLDVGSLTVGTHDLRMKHNGYTDSDKDTIQNDSFTVPA